MSDLLDNEPRPRPRWVLPAAVLGAVAVLIAVAARSPSPSRPRSAATSPSPSPNPVTSLPTPSQAGGACGGDVTLPLVTTGPRPSNTQLRLLVGDRDLRLVDVDTGAVNVLGTRAGLRSVTQLASSGGEVAAVLRNPCDPQGGQGRVGLVDIQSGSITSTAAGDEILPGTPTTVLTYGVDGQVHLRDLHNGSTASLPTGWSPVARTGTSYVVSVDAGGADSTAPPTLGIGDPRTRRLTTTIGVGSVVAGSPERLFWVAGGCDPNPCLLTTTTVRDGASTARAIHGQAWGGVVSPDGEKMAFRLPRANGQFGNHPGPPNDVAVLDTRADRLQVLPGFVLPPKAGLTLAWSPDSTWLVIGADLGTGALVLIWREGMARPAEVPIPPTGGGTTGPPALLVLAAQSR